MKKRIISLFMTVCMICAMLPCIPVQAAMNINIGDYVQMGTYYGQPILWRCVDKDENGPLMLSDRILCLKAFDASGDNTSGSHGRGYDYGSYRRSDGSNYWADSNIRDWLNSESGSVNWTCGNPPDKEHMLGGYNAYDKEAGFLTNFTQSEKNAMLTVAQKSLLDGYENSSNINENYHRWNYEIKDVVQNYDTAYSESVTDKMFLLDVKQVNAVYNNLSDYYIGKLTQACVDNSEYKDSNLNKDNNWYYWLRSPGCLDCNGFSVRGVYSDGHVVSYNANYVLIGVRPAFYLDLSSSTTKSGSGTESDPYTIGEYVDTSPKIVFTQTSSVKALNATSGVLVVAGFDENDNMTKIECMDGYSAELSGYENCKKIKAFLWNNLNDMQPICDSASVKVE